MKTLQLFSVIAILLATSNFSFAQSTKSESFKVDGNCGMCKKKIEKAAKDAGAGYAVWNMDSKMLTVKYEGSSTNPARMQQKIADAGYDTPKFKATEEAYNNLHGCCKYERTEAQTACCSGEKCDNNADCCKDGICVMTHEDHNNAKAIDCCKDGKCSQEVHDGKDCCKKS